MSRGKPYFQKNQIENLIATGRLVLAAVFLMAIWLDPSEPAHYARLTYGLLMSYLLYSLVVGVMTWRQNLISNHLPIVTHSIDLLTFSILMFLTNGPNSPFFVYFIFLLVCSTMRWQWRGTFWSAIAALSVVIALALFPANLLHEQTFELNRFIIRLAYLAVVASLLGYLSIHEQSLRTIFTMLAEWPRTVPDELETMTKETLVHAAKILGVPRMLMIWEEEEEPWLYLVLWSQDNWQYFRERPDAFGTLIAGQLAGSSFFCRNAGEPKPLVVQNSPSGLQEWRMSPLQRELQERFTIDAVFVSALKSEKLTGYLMALDKKAMTADDLVLGEIIAHEVVARFDSYYNLKQLQQAATADAQIRLARDLHDGLLQSLTGVALQLETARRLIDTDPRTARDRIQEIQQFISAEQSDLRSHISELRPILTDLLPEDYGFAGRLEKLAERISLQWDTSVKTSIDPSAPRISRSMAREIYFVVNESLINAVRHSGASCVRAELSFSTDRVHITVKDDGHGFSFQGRYDLAELFAMKRGPVTLKERIAALGGTLSIYSRESGTDLDVSLPLRENGGSHAY